MIQRSFYLKAVRSILANNPVCALLGPRQCGKTTLAQQFGQRRRAHYFDLETATGRARLAQPELALAPLTGLIVIDEIQRQPELSGHTHQNASRFFRGQLILTRGKRTILHGIARSLEDPRHGRYRMPLVP